MLIAGIVFTKKRLTKTLHNIAIATKLWVDCNGYELIRNRKRLTFIY